MKKVLIHSNHCRAFTGFGKATKLILEHLYKTGKYEIVELSNGVQADSVETKTLPWKCIGGVPNDASIHQRMKADKGFARHVSYGQFAIDSVIEQEKPDVYIGLEDIWAFRGVYVKPWWHHLTPVIWTTLDSVPMLEETKVAASQTDNFYVWASFAEREMKELGFDVGTLHGPVDSSRFKRLDNRQELRQQFGLDDDFVIGFVFRNQLRKSVPNLLKGFKMFMEKNPDLKTKLLLHTSYDEGWDIPKLVEEIGVPNDRVVTTYRCAKCRGYFINKFVGKATSCRCCGAENTAHTTNVSNGITDDQLNEIYNLMDVYCHPFTSGGQELPVQEAKLCELITLVTNYSCGEDFCTEESAGLPLDWDEYREPGTQFVKATTKPESICEQLEKVLAMSEDERAEAGKKARSFVEDNLNVEKICAALEEVIDNAPEVDWEGFEFASRRQNPDYELREDILDHAEWIIDLYKNVLNVHVSRHDADVKKIEELLRTNKKTREVIHKQAIQQAQQHNFALDKPDLAEMLDVGEEDKKLLISVPHSATEVIFASSFIEPLHKMYPDYKIYVATDRAFMELIEEHPLVEKTFVFHEGFNQKGMLEGAGDHGGYFDIAFSPSENLRRSVTYTHNGEDKTTFKL